MAGQNLANHDPLRTRKLLLHKKRSASLTGRFAEGIHAYSAQNLFRARKAKALIGLAKGKKFYDKRETIKAKESKREVGAGGEGTKPVNTSTTRCFFC